MSDAGSSLAPCLPPGLWSTVMSDGHVSALASPFHCEEGLSAGGLPVPADRGKFVASRNLVEGGVQERGQSILALSDSPVAVTTTSATIYAAAAFFLRWLAQLRGRFVGRSSCDSYFGLLGRPPYPRPEVHPFVVCAILLEVVVWGSSVIFAPERRVRCGEDRCVVACQGSRCLRRWVWVLQLERRCHPYTSSGDVRLVRTGPG